MYNLIEFSDNYSTTLGSLWQYYRGELVLNTVQPWFFEHWII